MKTIRLWLQNDVEIPQFKRLQYEIVDVSFADIFQKGVHPWQEKHENIQLLRNLGEILNQERCKLASLKDFPYCRDVSDYSCRFYWSNTPLLLGMLNNLNKELFFIDSLSYTQLFAIAKERLQRIWNHQAAYTMAKAICPNFDDLRSFIRNKDDSVKLSGYADIDRYDLSQILTPDDFYQEERLIIEHGLPSTNFRTCGFLGLVTDEQGRLCITDKINHFQMIFNSQEQKDGKCVVYNGYPATDHVRLIPELHANPIHRKIAKQLASKWRLDNGQYCFTASIGNLEDMSREADVQFPGLYGDGKQDSLYSSGVMINISLLKYVIWPYMTQQTPGDSIRKVLQHHGVSMSGRKESLLEKVAGLAVKVYQEQQAELDGYFHKNHFIRIFQDEIQHTSPFDLLQGEPLGQFILAMYAVKHLRGNTVLDARHENDAYELIDLARALLHGDITMDGVFLRAE